MRPAAFVRALLCLILVIITSTALFAQGEKMRLNDKDELEMLRGENPAARDRWFRKGRNTPDGRPAAQWLQRGYAQKMRFRMQRPALLEQLKQQISGTTLVDLSATTPVADATAIWAPMGPGPIVDDGLIGQNYGPNTGRATAVAVNPGDLTGNTVVVGGAYGGVWLSTNAATADPRTIYWSPILEQQASLAVGSVSWSPDGTVLLVGSGEGNSAWDSYYGVGFFRSTDNGTNWTHITTTTDGHTFNGMAIQRQAWSKTTPNIVTAAVRSATQGVLTGLNLLGNTAGGVYYSTDSGQSWKLAALMDGTTGLSSNPSVTAVVWNPSDRKFYAAVRYHGIYVSGVDNPTTFTRLGTQPDAASTGLNSSSTCPTVIPDPTNPSCPIYRAEIAANPNRNELYVWWVKLGSSDVIHQGFWKSTNGGVSWTKLTDTGFTNCSDPTAGTSGADQGGCGATQGFFNMTLLAVPNPGNSSFTDLYAGGVNIYKCTMDPATPANASCGGTSEPYKFMNLTHAYGCDTGGDPAHVHPDAHDMSTVPGDSSIIYFAHDGGISRTVNSSGLSSALCTAHNAFENASYNIGSMTQLVWGTAIPNDGAGMLAGAQDNGSMMVYNGFTPTNGTTWIQANGGDGGFTAIDPGSTSTFYTSNTNVAIQKCTKGTNCKRTDFTNSLGDPATYLVDNTDLSGDKSAFYSPYILDPQASNLLFVGTCRIWRGPTTRTSASTWGGFAVSQFLNTTQTCTTSNGFITGIGTGGALVAGKGSKVVWATLDDGTVWMTLDQTAATSTTPATFQNVSPPLSQNPGPAWNGPGFLVSSVAVDPVDTTGKTAYITIQGFNVTHVFKTTNAGTSWTDLGTTANGLPDAPANNIAIDPDDHNVVYVATDLGVYSLDQSVASPQWIEVGPAASTGNAGFLPNVTVFRVIIQKVGTRKLLKAVTYGRGVWIADITTGGTPGISVSPANPISFGSVTYPSSTTQTVTIKNTGTASLTILSANGPSSGNYSVDTVSCGELPVSIAQGASCEIAVTFTPATANGTLTDSIVLTENTSAGHTTTINLTGTAAGIPAAGPGFSATPNPVAFGFSKVNINSSSINLKISNPGTATLNIASITASNMATFVRQSGTCPTAAPAQLAAGASCTDAYVFHPTNTTAQTGTLTFTSNASSSPNVIAFTGTGANPTVSTSPTTTAGVVFGGKPISTASTQSVTLTNTSQVALAITSVVTSGAEFSQTNTCASSVAAGEHCTITVTFNPATIGSKTGTLTVGTDAVAPNNSLAFNLSGTGEDYSLAAPTPSTATVTAGTAASFTLGVTGVSGSFSSAVSFSCSSAGLGTGMSCTFNPSSVTPSSSTASTVLSVSTLRRSSTTIANDGPSAPSGSGLQPLALLLGLPGMAVLLPTIGRRRLTLRKKLVLAGLVILSAILLVMMTSCGGGGSSGGAVTPGTNPGSYTVTVNTTSGSLTHSTTVSVTVQ